MTFSNSNKFRKLSLTLALGFRQLNIVGCLLCILCLLMAASYFWLVPALRAQVDNDALVLATLQAQNTAIATQHSTQSAPSALDNSQLDFLQQLGNSRQLTSYYASILDASQASGLQILNVEFRTGIKVSDKINRQDLSILVRGPYSNIRKFTNSTMGAMPFLSLNNLEISRDTVANPAADARFDFSVYLLNSSGDSAGNKEPPPLQPSKPVAENQAGTRP